YQWSRDLTLQRTQPESDALGSLSREDHVTPVWRDGKRWLIASRRPQFLRQIDRQSRDAWERLRFERVLPHDVSAQSQSEDPNCRPGQSPGPHRTALHTRRW